MMRVFLFILVMLAAPMAFACSAQTDCTVGDRVYRISLPEGQTGPIGAVIWAHGYRGSAAGVMRNGSLRKMLHANGLALIALQGVDGTWDLPNGPRTPDSTGAVEFDYIDAVISDASAQFSIDPARLVASGFSAGGMLVWNLACARSETFAGFVPFSGTFWLKPSENCSAAATASLIHIHGDADKTVPLGGRAIGPTRQGKVAEALAMFASQGGFTAPPSVTDDTLRCANRTNSVGNILEYCLFDGGHSFRTEHLEFALDRLKSAGNL